MFFNRHLILSFFSDTVSDDPGNLTNLQREACRHKNRHGNDSDTAAFGNQHQLAVGRAHKEILQKPGKTGKGNGKKQGLYDGGKGQNTLFSPENHKDRNDCADRHRQSRT